MSTAIPERLRGWDCALIAAFCLVLFGYALVESRPLTMHEAVLPENAREMAVDHDWLVPKVGGHRWLERPPLPQWVTIAVGSLVGGCDREWCVRLGPVLVGTAVVLLAAWMASLWLGRRLGIFTALILATMWEFYTYASDAEADIYLCLIVTAAMAVFVKLEFACRPAEDESLGFFGRRPWLVLAFFVLFGMTNLAKGLIFGTLMVAVPVAGYLLGNRDLRALRRYVWFWGWLAFAAVALPWPIAVYCRYPDVLDLWASDYLGRLNRGYVREPVWYYAAYVPYVILPWTLPALVGLWTTARAAWRRSGLERFLWCWGVLTPLVFTIPQGKHHHYLLQLLIPWAVLAALGSVRLWQALLEAPRWARHPAVALLLFAVPVDLALVVLRSKIPGPSWVVAALLAAWPLLVLGLRWSMTRREPRLALTSLFGILGVVYCAAYSYKTHEYNRYYHDILFLRQARTVVPAEQTILVNFDSRPLDAHHLLFYLHDHAGLLHNLTYLRDAGIHESEVYVVGRGADAAELAEYGTPRIVLQSAHTRGENGPGHRWTLFCLRFHEGLRRVAAPSVIGTMQSSGRAVGPFLR